MCAALGKRIAFGSIDLCYQNHESGGGKSPPCSSAPDWSAGITREGAVGVRIVLAGGIAGPRAWITRDSENALHRTARARPLYGWPTIRSEARTPTRG